MAPLLLLATSRAAADATPLSLAPEPETRGLDELHKAALAEGGKLVVYAGGDAPNAYVAVETSFKNRFPGMDIRIVTDLSKYHDARWTGRPSCRSSRIRMAPSLPSASSLSATSPTAT